MKGASYAWSLGADTPMIKSVGVRAMVMLKQNDIPESEEWCSFYRRHEGRDLWNCSSRRLCAFGYEVGVFRLVDENLGDSPIGLLFISICKVGRFSPLVG